MKDKELMLLMHKRAEHAEMEKAGPVNTWSATHPTYYIEGKKTKGQGEESGGGSMIDKAQMYSVLEKVAKHFGLKAQMGKTVEELVELTHEIVKANKGEKNLPYIIDEIADVENMLDQLKILYGIENEVREIRWNKMVRTCNVSRIYDPNWDSEIKNFITAEEQ